MSEPLALIRHVTRRYLVIFIPLFPIIYLERSRKTHLKVQVTAIIRCLPCVCGRYISFVQSLSGNRSLHTPTSTPRIKKAHYYHNVLSLSFPCLNINNSLHLRYLAPKRENIHLVKRKEKTKISTIVLGVLCFFFLFF
jgi:hypothetical protein